MFFKYIFSIFYICFNSNILYSQDMTTAIWNFGVQARVDFRTDPPTVSSSSIYMDEGCASICDENGNLLLYTRGDFFYLSDDSYSTNMPNILAGTGSTAQSALIVPFPDHPNQFYIFSNVAQATPDFYYPDINGTSYAIFDLSLNGGLGELINAPTQILASASEKLTGVRSCNENEYWIISHEYPGNAFYAWKLTATGLSAPVVSYSGFQTPSTPSNVNAIGYLRASYDGNKLAMVTNNNGGTASYLELFDFNFSTGEVSNPILKSFPNESIYSVCFSPDNTKIYCGMRYGTPDSRLYQFDATAQNNQELAQSQITVGVSSSGGFGSIDNAINGKMYVAQIYENYLGVINYPNNLGLDCQFQLDGLQLADSTLSWFGLNNSIASPLVSNKIELLAYDTINSCDLSINLTIDYNEGDVQWSNGGNTNNLSVSETGTYQVSISNYCINISDSVYVDFDDRVYLNLTNDTILCKSDSFTIKAEYQPSSCNFIWSTSEVGDSISVNETGIYSVTAYSNTCVANDTIKVEFINIPTLSLINDTTLCFDKTFILNSNVSNVDYLWSTGDKNNTITINESGTYWLTINDKSCISSDTINVEFYNNVTKLKLPNVFSPNGDGINDKFEGYDKSVANFSINIYDRWGKLVFNTNDSNKYWDGMFKGFQCNEGIYYWTCSYFNECQNEIIETKGILTLLR